MSGDVNRHGLSRDIPDPVARAVRQRCGFGCIVCGCAIVQNDHFDPEFARATEHRPEGITLLCGSCHDKKTRGLLSLDDIRRFNATPYCKRNGFVRDDLFLSTETEPQFRIGGATFRRRAVVTYDGVPLIWFEEPEESAGPIRLYAELRDYDAEHLLTICGNVWQAGTHHFDIKVEGAALEVRKKPGDIILRMVREEGAHLALERLRMSHGGFKVSVERGGWLVIQRSGSSGGLHLKCPNIHSTLRLFSDGHVEV
jgi:hypothetical protein